MRTKKFLFAIFFCLAGFILVSTQSSQSSVTVKVEIRPATDVVRSGESVEITLSNFTDSKGAKAGRMYPLVVFAQRGKLEGGMSYSGFVPVSGMQGILFFPFSNEKIQYKSPSDCEFRNDFISVYNTQQDDKGHSAFMIMNQIAREEITIICPNSAIVTYKDYYHTARWNSTTTKNIDLKLLINFEKIGKQIPRHLTIKSLKVIRFNGIHNYIAGETKDENRLISVNPGTRGYALQLQLSPDNKRVIAVNFPLIEVNLKWNGTDAIVPPDQITIGPVSVKKKKKTKKKDTKKIKSTMSDKWTRKMEKMKALNSVFGLMSHPDFKVKGGDGVRFVQGGGEFKKKDSHWNKVKIFKWEVWFK